MNHWQGWLYVAAVLIPLGAFVVELLGGRVLRRLNAYIATGAIATSFVLSLVGLVSYLSNHPDSLHGIHAESLAEADAEGEGEVAPGPEAAHGADTSARAWTGSVDWVVLGAGLQADGNDRTPLSIPLGIYIDGLAVIMFAMVTFIATLIHIYSMGYMSDDPGYHRFFAFLSLFCFSMLGLVASASIFMVFIFWELVGVCSYLLIGFWYEEKANCDAANKAFIVNRVGDVGMLVGLGVLWTSLGTFNIDDINRNLRDDHGRLYVTRNAEGTQVAELRDRETGQPQMDALTGLPRQIPMWLLAVAGLGVFAGCVGKSAQFPLHVWLPDAMAGPTPVSALIHAATMVAAGVYLVGRFYPVFTPDVLLYIAYTGGITLFIAATIAVVQSDYKKVLAYSTVSQLGFMMLGLGVGGWAAGLFHLLTHAFFKALLFLGAGSVYHSVHTYEMPRLGGLRKKMPITAWTMLLATMAISGVPLFSGFYSKDAILASALAFVQEPDHGKHFLLLALPSIGAMITAFYMFRMWFMLFTGTSRSATAAAEAHAHLEHVHAAHGPDDAHAHGHGHHEHADPVAHAHESPPIMTWPLILLAIPTVMIGWPVFIIPILGGTPILENLLNYSSPLAITEHHETAHQLALGISILIATVGIGLAAAFYYYSIFSAAEFARRAAPLYDFLRHKWYFDEIYHAAFVRPTLALARAAASFDRVVIDGIVNGSASVTAGISRFGGWLDRTFVDGAVNLIARITYIVGDWGRALQTGHLRGYLMVLAVALVALSIGLFRWIQLG
jgi:proton-translocating NADH-quinone oxidoreductase chain L